MKKFLITGFSGFVSRHFIEYLEKQNIRAIVKGIDVHYPHLKQEDFKFVELDFDKIDLLDKGKVENIIFEFQPDFILHLASFSSVAFSWKEPNISFQNNTNIFLNLLETVSPYAVARVSQELLSKIYAHGYGLDVVMTRSFNHIGTFQKDVFVLPSFVKQIVLMKNRGSQSRDLITGDIEIVRDFTDVRDVVLAYYLLLTAGEKGEVYNVCSGTGWTLREIIGKISDLLETDVKPIPNLSLYRPDDNRAVIGSNEKIKKAVGWTPKHSLEDTLRTMIQYWQEHIG